MRYKLRDVEIEPIEDISTDEILFLRMFKDKDDILFIYLTKDNTFRIWFNLVDECEETKTSIYFDLPSLRVYAEIHKSLEKEVDSPKYKKIFSEYVKDPKAFKELMEIIRVECLLLD